MLVQVEIHFFHPFELTEAGVKLLKTKVGPNSDENVEYLWGDEGHLLFKEARFTVPVIRVGCVCPCLVPAHSEATLARPPSPPPALPHTLTCWRTSKLAPVCTLTIAHDVGRCSSRRQDPSVLISDKALTEDAEVVPVMAGGHLKSPSQLSAKETFICNVRDANGNLYSVSESYVRIFSYKIGMVRFTVSANAPVDVQAILDVQNGIMRLKGNKGRLSVLDETGTVAAPFEPKVFVRSVLQQVVGHEVPVPPSPSLPRCWHTSPLCLPPPGVGVRGPLLEAPPQGRQTGVGRPPAYSLLRGHRPAPSFYAACFAPGVVCHD